MATTRSGRGRIGVALAALCLAVTACGGGGDDDATPAAPPAPDDSDEGGAATGDNEPSGGDGETDADDGSDDATSGSDVGSIADFTAGPVRYRVVNLLDEPVDLYARTQGIVKAYLLEAGVAPGAVTDFYAPPTDGRFVVAEAGSTDPTCVTGCDHFIAELTAFDTDGPVHTVLLHADGGTRRAFDLWEAPEAGSIGNANAMATPDPARGLVVVTAIAVTGADFGLRLGLVGVPGCQDAANASGVLIGGNQTPPFTYDGPSADIVLYDNQDRECAGEPVGGPFTVNGGPGLRSHLFLSGSPGALQALVVPMDGDTPTAGDDAGEADGGDDPRRDDAIAMLAQGLADEIGLPIDQATCAGEYLVDAIGVDVLMDGDDLVDIDLLPAEVQDIAVAALTEALEPCGIDVSLL